MRITAGLYKGRSLRCPKEDIRPVMSKMRESIFSMMVSRFGSLENLRFLDLFCGSAIMSVEAASRGISFIEAVDKDRRKKKILEENLSIVQVPRKLHIVDVYRYLAQAARPAREPAEPFDIIYIDPPFQMDNKAKILQSLAPSLYHENSLVMIHLPKQEESLLPPSLSPEHSTDKAGKQAGGLVLERTKYYGGSALCLYGQGPVFSGTPDKQGIAGTDRIS
ncbi:RsmD family RNA methyltransferase [Candidatus Haliotispira prima]|uniref:RsmD family RNA methyltransferase n=1 Tax=Candidatus Haliotispira prima TaxID=3034016 RepID=A0ABY8MI12_9SPIO|nr:RsmD family RNA methyltransferase [Candidatus Haliotispira prima]